MASSEESARHQKTLRKTFLCVFKMAKTALQPQRNLFLFTVKTVQKMRLEHEERIVYCLEYSGADVGFRALCAEVIGTDSIMC